MFRGREQSRPELGFRLLQRLAEDVSDVGVVEATPKQDGRNMMMVIAPHKKPQAKRQAPAARPRSPPRPPDRHAVTPARHPRSRGGAADEGIAMPKKKTHCGIAKRIKVTGSGKLMRQQAGLRHRLEVKSSKETRDLCPGRAGEQGRRQAREEAPRPLSHPDPAPDDV